MPSRREQPRPIHSMEVLEAAQSQKDLLDGVLGALSISPEQPGGKADEGLFVALQERGHEGAPLVTRLAPCLAPLLTPLLGKGALG